MNEFIVWLKNNWGIVSLLATIPFGTTAYIIVTYLRQRKKEEKRDIIPKPIFWLVAIITGIFIITAITLGILFHNKIPPQTTNSSHQPIISPISTNILSPTITVTPTISITPIPTSIPISTPSSTYAFSGANTQVTSPPFHLKDGIVIFRETYDGTYLNVELLDTQNLNNGYLVTDSNGIVKNGLSQLRPIKEGTYTGVFQENIPPGTYVFWVRADGNWTIKIEQY